MPETAAQAQINSNYNDQILMCMYAKNGAPLALQVLEPF
jgi:hypothetical protein